MDASIFSGTIPALMTPCKADRSPDFDRLVSKAQELIAAGMSAVVYCGSMGDWPLLTDEQLKAYPEPTTADVVPHYVARYWDLVALADRQPAKVIGTDAKLREAGVLV